MVLFHFQFLTVYLATVNCVYLSQIYKSIVGEKPTLKNMCIKFAKVNRKAKYC